MTDKTSFLKLKDWVSELQTVLGSDLLIAVACNKCDLSSRREVSIEQAQDFAASLGATLFETSAKTNQVCANVFGLWPLQPHPERTRAWRSCSWTLAPSCCSAPKVTRDFLLPPPPSPSPSALEVTPLFLRCSCRQAGSCARCCR